MRRPRPLSPLIYLSRNSGRTIPMAGVIVLSVLLVGGIVALMNSIPLSIRITYSYSRHYLAVSPRGDPSMIDVIRDRVTEGSPVPIERVILCRASGSTVRSIVGKWPFVVIGLSRPDMEFLLERSRTTALEGRLPNVGAPEAVISQPVAKNLNLRIGDVLLGPKRDEGYSPKDVRVVGIAHTDDWLMLNDIEYQRENHFPPIDNLLFFAKSEAEQGRLDRWAVAQLKGERAQTFAYFELEKDTDEMFDTLYMILNTVIGLLVIVIAMVMAMLMNIYQSQRMVEFGLLQAIGFTKKRLVRKVIAEAAWVLACGWVMGLLVAGGFLFAIKALIFDPKAYALEPFDLTALLYTLPIPVMILSAAVATVLLRFRGFDPVAVVERRIV